MAQLPAPPRRVLVGRALVVRGLLSAPLAAPLLIASVAHAEDPMPTPDEIAASRGEAVAPAEPAPAPAAAAEPSAKAPHPGEGLTIYAMTFSPGDHPFFKFGHNAIWIHDERAINIRMRDKVYNWGTFSFGDPALIPKFVVGRFMYWLSDQSLASTKSTYRRENRWVEVQELNLTPEQRVELQDAVEENLKKENRYYKYDYFGDNCSTRVRDHIDRITGGELRKVADGPGRLTLRQHTMRVTADTPLFATALSLALADHIDKPPTKWGEAFLPGELQRTLREVKIAGPDGAMRPLVKGEQRIVDANRPDPPELPPSWMHWFVGIGAVLGAVVAGLGKAARGGSKLARVALGLGLSGVSALLGFFGLFFLFVWFFTDHVAGYGNENIFVCTPFAWLVVGSGINVARGKPSSIAWAAKVVKAAAALALLGVVVKVLPWFDQDNWWFLAALTPPWVAAAWSLNELAKVTPPASAPAASKPAAPPKEPDAAPKAKKPKEKAPPPAASDPGADGS